MFGLEIFGESRSMNEIAGRLEEIDGISRVRVLTAKRPRHSVVVASVRPRVADLLLRELRGQGVSEEDITLSRLEVVARASR